MASLSKNDVLVLIPAYNEEANIVRVISEILKMNFSVLVVDDGSTDGMLERIKGFPITILPSKTNQGKGLSLRKGIDWFLKSRFQALVMMDADGQHEPRELNAFLETLQKGAAEMVIGSRLHDPKGMSIVRRATNRFMSWLISSIAGQKITDTQCGYRAATRRAFENLALNTDHFEIESEIILQTARAGFVIASIPIRCVYAQEKSRINPVTDTIRFIQFIFSFCFRR